MTVAVKTAKLCRGCNRTLPLSEFRAHKGHGSDNLDSKCRECMSSAAKAKSRLLEPSVNAIDPKVGFQVEPRFRAMTEPYLKWMGHQATCEGCKRHGKLLDAAVDAFVAFFNEFTNPRLGGLPEHAREWVRAALENPLLLLNVPPRHAKTTIMVVWFSLWQYAISRDVQIIIVSKTTSLGEKVSRKIVNEFETNAGLIKAFGRFRPRDQARPWRVTKGELEVEGKDLSMATGDLSLQVRGSGQQVLGMEAHWVIADDITDRRVSRSESERSTEWDYFLGDVLTRLAPNGRAFCIGQRVDGSDIYGRLSEMQDDNGVFGWHQIKTPAILDEETESVLWPGQWPYAKLVAKRKSIGSPLFSCMYQQTPEISGEYMKKWWLEGNGTPETPGCYDRSRSVGQGWSNESASLFVPVPTVRVISIDPSPTQYAGIIVADIVYQSRAAHFNVAVVDIVRLPPGHGLRGMVDAVESLAKQHRVSTCIFETNSAKWLREDPAWNRMAPMFRAVIGHTTTRWNKDDTKLGIWSMAADFEAGRIRLPYQTPEDRAATALLTDEALAYPNGKTWDVLMALSFIKLNYKKLIPREFLPTHFTGVGNSRSWDMERLKTVGAWRR